MAQVMTNQCIGVMIAAQYEVARYEVAQYEVARYEVDTFIIFDIFYRSTIRSSYFFIALMLP